MIGSKNKTHRIHVWCIYLHLADLYIFYGKCWQIFHTWILWETHLFPVVHFQSSMSMQTSPMTLKDDCYNLVSQRTWICYVSPIFHFPIYIIYI